MQVVSCDVKGIFSIQLSYKHFFHTTIKIKCKCELIFKIPGLLYNLHVLNSRSCRKLSCYAQPFGFFNS